MRAGQKEEVGRPLLPATSRARVPALYTLCMSKPTVRYARTADSFNIAFTVEGRGPPLISLPSPFHHVVRLRDVGGVAAQIERAAKHMTSVHYDHRGQGLSTRCLPDKHRWEDFQLDLEAVADALGLERFSLFAPGF